MLLAVIDTETGGLDPTVHSLLSVGVWTIDTVKKELYNPLYFLVNEPRIVTTPGAMAVNGLRIEDIKEKGLTPREALQELRKYCKGIEGPQPGTKVLKNPIPVGHNVGFDIGFLQRLVSQGGGGILPFHYRTIDVPTLLLSMHIAGLLPEDISSSKKAFDHFGLDRGDVHHALQDAQYTGTVYLKLLDILSGVVDHER